MLTLLCQEAEALASKGVTIEIIVYDDCSPLHEMSLANSRYCEAHSICRFMQGNVNVGRSVARNRLVRAATSPWLLFIDSDLLPVHSDFLARYVLLADDADAIVGGLSIPDGGQAMRSNLRYLYERRASEHLTPSVRQHKPYASFHVSNLLVRRSVMMSHPFDESISRYGYEDVLLGKQLQSDGIRVRHIDNAVCFGHYDDNAAFLAKTEEGLRTLYAMRQKLRGYSGIQQLVERAAHLGLAPLLRLAHRVISPLLRKNLLGAHPSLVAFLMYRVGYYAILHDSPEVEHNHK